MSDPLHVALKTEPAGKADGGGVEFLLMRLQEGRDRIAYSLHARPHTFSSAGIQTTDLLDVLGFERSRCAFMVGGECYARAVPEGLDIQAFADAFPRAYEAIGRAERHFNACGLFQNQTQGWGFFMGNGGHRRSYDRTAGGGDGHHAPKSQRMKESEDEAFRYVFTWLEGGPKGWVTHYRPKRAPLSPEVESVFRYLGLGEFSDCPEFDFERCHWRFTEFENRGHSVFDSNAEFAHGSFDAHATNFSPGVEQLLLAQATVEPFGMAILPMPVEQVHTRQRQRPARASRSAAPASPSAVPADSVEGAPSYEFDLAITFAGPQRPIAEEINGLLTAKGFRVFYDDAYPEQLWGKDLVVLFDEIYRLKSRYCLMIISPEYVERIWTNHERRSAQARALQERGAEYILPLIAEPTEVPGLPPTVGHIPLSRYTIPQIADMLIRKLEGN